MASVQVVCNAPPRSAAPPFLNPSLPSQCPLLPAAGRKALLRASHLLPHLVARMQRVVTNQTLLLVDELGKGTEVQSGTAVAGEPIPNPI